MNIESLEELTVIAKHLGAVPEGAAVVDSALVRKGQHAQALLFGHDVVRNRKH
jgi:hypothetical protein